MSNNQGLVVRIVRGCLPALVAVGVATGGPLAWAQQVRYYCDASHVYYPMVTTCDAGWRKVPAPTRGLRQPDRMGPADAEPPLPAPAPRPQVTREVMAPQTAPTSAAALPTPEVSADQPPTPTANHDDHLPAPSNDGVLPIAILVFVAAVGALALMWRRALARPLRRAISWFARFVPIGRK